MTVNIYTLNDLFAPLEEWVEIILKVFSKMEIKAYRLDRHHIIELLLFAYEHDHLRNIITSPLAFKQNYSELYHAYVQQWEK
jgi:hypothetical protein